mgnify:FL=1
MYPYDIREYQDLLHQCLRHEKPHLLHLATPALCSRLLAKGLTPGHGRGFVVDEAVAQARADLRAMVGKVPSTEIAIREAEINQLAARLS